MSTKQKWLINGISVYVPMDDFNNHIPNKDGFYNMHEIFLDCGNYSMCIEFSTNEFEYSFSYNNEKTGELRYEMHTTDITKVTDYLNKNKLPMITYSNIDKTMYPEMEITMYGAHAYDYDDIEKLEKAVFGIPMDGFYDYDDIENKKKVFDNMVDFIRISDKLIYDPVSDDNYLTIQCENDIIHSF